MDKTINAVRKVNFAKKFLKSFFFKFNHLTKFS